MESEDAWRLTENIHAELGKGDPFAAAIRATRMAMIITDPRQPDNPIVFANDALMRLTGYERDEIVGHNCRFLQGPDTDPAALQAIREAIRDGRDVAVDILTTGRRASRSGTRSMSRPCETRRASCCSSFPRSST
jgi:PAS domain S-box-containing protein